MFKETQKQIEAYFNKKQIDADVVVKEYASWTDIHVKVLERLTRAQTKKTIKKLAKIRKKTTANGQVFIELGLFTSI